jgi:tRNA threonylcarbamoyladenosine biosynthesis protein TsaE
MLRARTTSVSETAAMAAALAAVSSIGDLILLSGDLGAGKTAFVKGFGSALGVTEPIISPTFTMVREYQGRLKLYHLDVYRVSQLSETVDLGLGELLDDEAVTVIEWGEHILAALPADYLEIRLELGEADDERLLEITAIGSRWSARARGLARVLAPWLVDADHDHAVT